jgi:hypothetical protein
LEAPFESQGYRCGPSPNPLPAWRGEGESQAAAPEQGSEDVTDTALDHDAPHPNPFPTSWGEGADT